MANEQLSGDGHWAAFGVDRAGGQPITTSRWIDRLAPHAAAVVAWGRARPTGGSRRCATTRPGRWACATTSGRSGLSRRGSRSSTCPAARCSPTTSPRRCSTWRCTSPAPAPMIDARRAGPAALAVRPHRAAGLRPRGLRRAGRVRADAGRSARLPGQARLQGAGGQVQRPDSRLDRRRRRLPERRRDLRGVHDAGFPDKFMPFMEPDPLRLLAARRAHNSPTDRCCAGCAAARSAARTTSSPTGAGRGRR